MKTRLLLFVLCVAVLLAGPVRAKRAPRVEDILRAVSPTATVPPEWDGVWATTDSIFLCSGELEETSTGADTMCAGKQIPPPPGFGYTCTGIADATTASLTCTVEYDPYLNCHATSVAEVNGTLTGDTYFFVITDITTFSGTGVGCGSLPSQCSIIHIHGVRTGPAPPEYCAIGVRSASWGQIKMYYR